MSAAAAETTRENTSLPKTAPTEHSMSETTDLITLPAAESALEVFKQPDGLDPYLRQIREAIDDFQPDTSTRKGREAIASMAHRVAKIKVAIDNQGKALVAEMKQVPALIDSSRKKMRETLDKWRDEVRAPLTDWESAEEERLARHRKAIVNMKDEAADASSRVADDLRASIAMVEAVAIGSQWEEFAVEAAHTKDSTLMKLRDALAARERYDAEQVELQRLRAEAAERARRDEDERIAREATEKAQREADARARAEREATDRSVREARADADREAAELRLQAQRAEQAREEAERRAAAERTAALQREEEARRDADRQAEEAVAAERARRAAEEAEAAAEAKRREANRNHRAAINRAALAAFVEGGMPEECAKVAITLIARGAVPAVSINY